MRGYPSYQFKRGATTLNRTAHQLVGITLIPNPDCLPELNHKDGDKTNSFIDNLEWVTKSGNIQHAYDTGLKKKFFGSDHWNFGKRK